MHILDLPVSWSKRQRDGFIDLSCKIEPLFKEQFSCIPGKVEESDDIFAMIDQMTGPPKAADTEIETLSFKRAIDQRLDRRRKKIAEGYGGKSLSRYTDPKFHKPRKETGLFPDKDHELAARQREKADKALEDYLAIANKLKEEESENS